MGKESWGCQLKDYIQKLRNEPKDGVKWKKFADFLCEHDQDNQLIIYCLEKAMQFYPFKSHYLALLLGNAYVETGEIIKGIEIIEKTLKDDKESATGYCFLIPAYMQLEEYDKAIKAGERTIEIDPYDEGYYLLGNAIEHKDIEKAVEYYKKAIELDPDYQAAWCSLGKLLSKSIDTIDESIECLKKAIELGHSYSMTGWSVLYLANAFWKKGFLEEADKMFMKAISEFQGGKENYEQYIDFLRETSGESEDYNIIRKAYEKNFNEPIFHRWYARFLEKFARTNEAEEVYQKAMIKFPNESKVFFWYAQFLEKEKKIEKAIELYKTAMGIFSENSRFYLWYLHLLEDLENKDKVKRKYQEAINRHPDDTDFYKYYAGFLISIDQRCEAENILKRAIDKFPDDPSIFKWYTESLVCYDMLF